MKEKIQNLWQWVTQKKTVEAAQEGTFRKWFQRDNLIVILLAGVLLLVIAMPTGKAGTGQKTEDSDTGQTSSEATGNGQGSNLSLQKNSAQSLSEYRAALEQHLSSLLGKMEDAGRVEVMITFAASSELVVEKDRPITRANTTEEDGAGGTRNIYEIDSGEATVYEEADGGKIPYVVKTLMPKVEGVLVAAQGAGKGQVSKNITEAVAALFDLESHKIKVVRMKS